MEMCTDTKRSFFSRRKFLRWQDAIALHVRKKGGVVRVRMRAHKSTCARRKPPKKNEWKNHFYEMKGDVGMSLHEKERNKKMPTPSLHLCFFQDYNVHFHAGNWMSRCCAVCFAYIMHS